VDENKKMAGIRPRSIPAITAATKRKRHDWSVRRKNSSAVRFIASLSVLAILSFLLFFR
jgi:hypothetical protein